MKTVDRMSDGWADTLVVHRLPGEDRGPHEILESDRICGPNQNKASRDARLPPLKAAPGNRIALQYQENGHVSNPDDTPGKAANRGTVYIYGTTKPRPTDTLTSIHKVWKRDGSGGDKRGILLATQAYDDGQCYESNNFPISKTRQEKFPHLQLEPMGRNLWCQNNIELPKDAKIGQLYTLYWVWDWPTAPNVNPTLPRGKAEIYTSCMDIEVVDSKSLDMTRAPEPRDATNRGNRALPKPKGGDAASAHIQSRSAKFRS